MKKFGVFSLQEVGPYSDEDVYLAIELWVSIWLWLDVWFPLCSGCCPLTQSIITEVKLDYIAPDSFWKMLTALVSEGALIWVRIFVQNANIYKFLQLALLK